MMAVHSSLAHAESALEFSAKTPFPEKFQWCVATAGHQIEGYNQDSDWWEFETHPGNIKNGERSGRATDHWNRMEQDVALMKSIHLKQYRFSVEWAKIEPKEGQINRDALKRYARLIRLLKGSGIEPMLTLHHFTFPQWVRAKGGWEWSGTPEAFTRFTRLVYAEMGADVRDWVTVNEPLPHVLGGYLIGAVPPGKKGELKTTIPVFIGMLRSHASAYHALHDMAAKSRRTIRVGMAHHLRTFDPAFLLNPLDHLVASTSDSAWNWMIPDALETGVFKMHVFFLANHEEEIPGLKGTQDYFGLNYYTGDLVALDLFGGLKTSNRTWTQKNDMGWDIYPEGMYRVLEATHKRYPSQTIMITENGIADAKDRKRTQFLRDHLMEVARAIQNKIPIEGYCYWSLLDNFEWDQGYSPRFGLFQTDYTNFARIHRPSVDYFSEMARTNRFPIEILNRVPASASVPVPEPEPAPTRANYGTN